MYGLTRVEAETTENGLRSRGRFRTINEMLELQFQTIGQTYSVPLALPGGIKIVGPLLMPLPQSSILARYEHRQWHIDGHRASSFECNGKVMLHFEDMEAPKSEAFGPFAHVSFPNGCCYADRSLFAELTATTARWRHLQSGKDWQAFFLVPLENA
jgi:hypothetical protein